MLDSKGKHQAFQLGYFAGKSLMSKGFGRSYLW